MVSNRENDTVSLVLFDGFCPLCHGFVRFLLRIDKKNRLRYAPLAGSTAADLYARLDLPSRAGESVILVSDYGGHGETAYFLSDAVLLVLRRVGGIWRLLSVLRFMPRFIRDNIYRFIARRRNRWFARYEACPSPADEHKELFLP